MKAFCLCNLTASCYLVGFRHIQHSTPALICIRGFGNSIKVNHSPLEWIPLNNTDILQLPYL